MTHIHAGGNLCFSGRFACAGLLLTLGGLLLTPSSQAQGIECKKPSTAVERTICADPSLLELDASLTGALNSALAATADQGVALTSDQRRWFSTLGKQCNKKRRDPAGAMSTCLAGAYGARIAALSGMAREASSRAPIASCTLIADRYHEIAEHHPLDTPLAALADPGSGIILAAPLGAMNGSVTDLADWAAAQQPPFTISDELSQALSFNSGSIERLPNTNFYSISTVQGPAQCVEALYFTVRDGQAQQVGPPPGFEDDAHACGVRRSYGTIDNSPAIFEETNDLSPSMKSSIKVATWGSDRFAAACKVSFSFVPRFTYRMLKDWDNSCTGYECEPMRVEAYRLAKAVQKDPAGTQRKLLDELSPDQQLEYTAAIQAAAGDAASSDSRC